MKTLIVALFASTFALTGAAYAEKEKTKKETTNVEASSTSSAKPAVTNDDLSDLFDEPGQ